MSIALLYTGAGGQLGTELGELARRAPDIAFAKGIDVQDVDLTDPFAIRDAVTEWARVVRSDSPSHRLFVLSLAAYTNVDKAEQDEETAFAVNGAGPAVIATVCAEHGIGLVHVSTDFVFPGDATAPYRPDDPAGPRTAYGRTKLAGDVAVRELHPSASWVVRTAWLYGKGGPNFVKTMARLEKTNDTISVVDDQVGSPTWARDLAERLLALVRQEPPPGTYHGVNGGEVSRHGLARAVFEELGADPDRVLATDSSAFVRAAEVPAYSVLTTEEWDGAGLPPFPSWREALAEAFRLDGDALRG